MTFAAFEDPVVYVLVEGRESILELDITQGGVTKVKQQYDLSDYLPLDENLGADGITFVTDEHLVRSGFVAGDGNPRVS